MPNVPDCSQNLVILSWTNRYGTWGGSSDNGSENTIYRFNDDLNWIKGGHNFKFGGGYQLTHYNGFGHEDISGLAGFSFSETGGPWRAIRTLRPPAETRSPLFCWATPTTARS